MKMFWKFCSKYLIIILFFVCWWFVGFGFFLPLFVAMILHLLLKKIVGRPRPFEMKQGYQEIKSFLSTSSFPSGHSTAASSLAVSMVLHTDQTLALWFILPALLVAVARVKTGVHYTTDVFGGIVLGALVTLAMNWITL